MIFIIDLGERGGSVIECRTPEREVRGSRPTAAVLCPWARHFTPRKYWLITQEAMAPSRHDWKIVDWDVKPQHNQPIIIDLNAFSQHYVIVTWKQDESWFVSYPLSNNIVSGKNEKSGNKQTFCNFANFK